MDLFKAADQLKKEHGHPHLLDLRFDEYRVRVGSNSRLLITNLAHYFDGFTEENELQKAEPDDRIFAIDGPPLKVDMPLTMYCPKGETRIKEELCEDGDMRFVRKIRTDMTFVFGAGFNFVSGQCLLNFSQVVNFINNRYIQYMLNRDCLLMHASALSVNGRGLAISGFSGLGKSTLALHMMNLGVDFLSNDRLMMRREGDRTRLYGVTKLPRINPGTIVNNPVLQRILTEEEKARYQSLPAEELRTLEMKYDADINELYGRGRFKLRADLDTLVILNWHHTREPMELHTADLVSDPHLFDAFIKSPGVFYQGDLEKQGAFSPHEYLKRLSGVRIVEIRGGIDFEGAVEALSGLLNG